MPEISPIAGAKRTSVRESPGSDEDPVPREAAASAASVGRQANGTPLSLHTDAQGLLVQLEHLRLAGGNALLHRLEERLLLAEAGLSPQASGASTSGLPMGSSDRHTLQLAVPPRISGP